MISVQALANTILKKSFEEFCTVTSMKLQKLIYFIYADYLKRTGEPLFSERFEVWKFGPVVSSVYYDFKAFGAERITRFARDAAGKVSVVKLNGSDAAISIERIWNKYKQYNGTELSAMTHRVGTAWSKACDRKGKYLSDEDIRWERA